MMILSPIRYGGAVVVPPTVPWVAGAGGTTNIRFVDGSGYTDVSPGGSSKQYAVYLNGNAIVFDNTVLKYSTDACASWSADISLSPAMATQDGFDFDGTYYYAVHGGNHVGRSSNLTSWSKPLVDASARGNTLAIKSGRLMVFNSGSEMAPTYSDNQGASYTTGGNILGLAAFTYGNSILKASASYFVCYCKRDTGGSYAQKITRSADGASWADSGYSFPTNNISTFPIALCHGNGIWVAVNSAGEIAYSTNDAASFNTSGFTATLPRALDHDGQKFILACENGVLVTSTDGNSWTAFATFNTYDFTSIMALA